MISILLAAWIASGAEQAQASGCVAVRQVLASEQACVEAPHGIVIASGGARAEDLAKLASIAEARFVLRFRREVPRYAIVDTEDGVREPKLFAVLEQSGYVWRLPWLSPQAMASGYRASITRAVTAQAEAKGLGAEQAASLVTAALAQQAGKWAPSALREREAGTLPHELGHGWFIHAFWPDATAKSGDHYGGPAPDWMDETAAVLMEDDALADRRRQQFAAIYAGADSAARARLLDLSTFLSGGHPALPKLDLPPGSAGVRVLTGAEAAGIAAAAGGFYLQARLFADYILARSGDPAVFRLTAEALASGKTMPQWLVDAASGSHLPATPAALQQDWERWLASERTTPAR